MRLFYRLIICTICVPDRSVWVSDSQQPFVEHPGMSPDVLYMKEKQSLVIPCRVTHPNVTTTLVKVSAGNMHEMRSHHVDLIQVWGSGRVKCIYTLVSSLVPVFSTRAHFCTQCTFQLFLTLQIIRHIVLILAAITLWRVCPFVCVRKRICVKVCADMFVSVGA